MAGPGGGRVDGVGTGVPDKRVPVGALLPQETANTTSRKQPASLFHLWLTIAL
jgi:hypothetical protein